MDDRFNTMAGWALFSGIVALGLSSISGHYFGADKAHRPHKMGYEIEGVVASEGGAAKDVPIETLLASADPAKGEQVFKKCGSCHTIAQGGANGIGPNLYGVVGEGIGQGAGGYAFSDALKGKGGNWDFASLNEWLKSPKKFADGTKMTFAGLPSAEDRAAVIVYLNSQGSNKPLPAAPAAAEAAPADAKAADAAKGGASEAAAAAPSGAASEAAKK
jgi:cytochrome c